MTYETTYNLFISCPKGLEYLLADELRGLGLNITQLNPHGVFGQTTLIGIYHICLWSRLANRVHLQLFSGQAQNEKMLYELCKQYHWQTLFHGDKTICIEFYGFSKQIRNAMFGAQVIKDAIVDYFRAHQNKRPSVEKDDPDIRIHAFLKNDQIEVSLDLPGFSLHQRGYRALQTKAPIKENLAAALLIRSNWKELAEKGYAFFDPMCGSGTLAIEAALIAANIAPGLLRKQYSFCHWLGHQHSLWEKARTLALKQVSPAKNHISGSDMDEKAIEIAKKNAELAGVGKLVHFATKTLQECTAQAPLGLIVTNPPYGERLQDPIKLIPLYQQLGKVLHQQFPNWQANILTSNLVLAKALGLRAEKKYQFFNGAIACTLYNFSMATNNKPKNVSADTLSDSSKMLFNRIKKNYANLKNWQKQSNISCYRVYDADLPEYAYAIDIYNDYAVLQEYKAPAQIPRHKAEARGLELLQTVPLALGIAPDKIIVKQRAQQKGKDQYQKYNQMGKRIQVIEGNALFWVNLYDYLDTGLFLDHRILRREFGKLPQGTRFLNCFCYTASASVHAALSGCVTTNIDLSNTYLKWAQDNFVLNSIPLPEHAFVQENVLTWLKTNREQFDVIFLDPPSFSNSKRMTETLDIQRDHVDLIYACMRHLTTNGTLYFSTNLRTFKLSPILSAKFRIQDISKKTIDKDFIRKSKIHQCFTIKAPDA